MHKTKAFVCIISVIVLKSLMLIFLRPILSYLDVKQIVGEFLLLKIAVFLYILTGLGILG